MRASIKTICIILGLTALASSTATPSLRRRKIICGYDEDDQNYAPVSRAPCLTSSPLSLHIPFPFPHTEQIPNLRLWPLQQLHEVVSCIDELDRDGSCFTLLFGRSVQCERDNTVIQAYGQRFPAHVEPW